MQDILRQALKLALVSALVASSAFASPQSQDPASQEPAKTPPPAQQQTQQQTGSQPVQQKDTVTPRIPRKTSRPSATAMSEKA